MKNKENTPRPLTEEEAREAAVLMAGSFTPLFSFQSGMCVGTDGKEKASTFIEFDIKRMLPHDPDDVATVLVSAIKSLSRVAGMIEAKTGVPMGAMVTARLASSPEISVLNLNDIKPPEKEENHGEQ